MISSFSFTTLGFLATVITILFALSGTSNFQSYDRKGYLSVFFHVYYIAIVSLISTAVFSVYVLSETVGRLELRCLVALFVSNLFQVLFLTIVICNLARKSLRP